MGMDYGVLKGFDREDKVKLGFRGKSMRKKGRTMSGVVTPHYFFNLLLLKFCLALGFLC